MNKSFPRFGSKPSPASPGNYVKDFARSIKHKSRRRRKSGSRPVVKLNPSTKPIPVELTRPDTSISGFGFLGIIFLICLALFAALAWFG